MRFYINVCQALRPMEDVKCPPGSSICMTVGNRTVGLGRSQRDPMYTGKSSASISYFFGDACVETPGFHYSSNIDFTCDRTAGPGVPEFVELTHDCQYRFTWRTVLVCPAPPPSETPCAVDHTHDTTGETNTLHLSSLAREGGYPVQFQVC